MLSNEQEFFLQVLADHMNKQKTGLWEGLDRNLLISIAKNQQCEGIVYDQTNIPEFQPLYAADLYYAANRKKLMNRIHQSFAENQISYLIFKGSEVAQYYPVPALRTMGDLDIMVHERDKQKAHELLLSIGCVNECLGINEWIYHIRDIKVELHHRLMNDELISLPEHKEFMKSVWNHATTEDGVQYHIDRNYHLAFLFLHLRKHLMNSGVGFRQFLDIAMVVKNGDIDWEYFSRTVDQLRITRFVSICFAFLYRWFGIKAPVIIEEVDEAFYQTATRRIFENGVFGYGDTENLNNYPIIQKKYIGRNRIKYYMSELFPPYKRMCTRNCAFLIGRPWLLGIAWIYRLGRYMVHAPSQTENEKKKDYKTVTVSQVEQREAYLNQWGLEL